MIEYKCSSCGAAGVKLWRQYMTFADHVELLCGPRALRETGEPGPIDGGGYQGTKYGRTDQIGGLVPAVPVDGESTFWGYTSVPQHWVDWWRALPLTNACHDCGDPPGKCDCAKVLAGWLGELPTEDDAIDSLEYPSP